MKPDVPNAFEKSLASPAARNYLFLAGACAALNFVLMAGYDPNIVVVFSVLTASAGLAMRWSITPFLYLLTVGYFLFDPGLTGFAQHFGRYQLRRSDKPTTEQLLIALGVVGYVASFFRLLSFWQGAAPARFRNRAPSVERAEGQLQRPFDNAPEEESYGVAVQVLACMALGVTAMMLLDKAGVRLSRQSGAPLERHLISFALFVGGAVASLASFHLVCLALESRRQSRERAYLALADILWNETRREQQRIDRWAAWMEDRARRQGKA